MIKDVSLRQLFPTEYIRVVTELDHAAIAQHTIDFCKSIGKYTTYHSKEDSAEWAKHPEIQKLIQDIKQVSNDFIQKTDRIEFKEEPYILIWGNVYNEFDEHGSHNHPRALFSGTYFANEDPAYSSLQFDSPIESMKMHDTQHYKHNTFPYKPVAGDMLMLPSWLYHRVPQQAKTEVPRVTLSFNIDYNQLRK